MTSGVLIRRANASDAATLAQLRFRWRTEEAGETGLDLSTYEKNMTEWLKTHEHSHFGFVAIRDEVTIGEGWLALVERVPGPGRFLRRSAYLQAIYIEPSQRNIGIGALLIDEMMKTARELDLDYVAVHPSAKSFPFYRRLGFEESDRLLEFDMRHPENPS
jgi:GNAT superfamily N-acetyltransferase